MAGEAVSVVVKAVGSLLTEEIKYLRSVSKQVGEAQTELTQLQSFLKDADSRQIKDETIRNLVREIRRLAYRIENVLETYAIEVASRKEGVGIQNAVKRFVCFLGEGKALHKVGSEIESIKTRLSTIRDNFITKGVRSQVEGGQSSNAMEVEQRQTYAHEVEKDFVGMEKDIEQLVSLITTDEERSCRVISIHGMGGLGKTTLARKIYNHKDVKRCYQGFAWVSISKQFKKETIFRNILKQLLKNEEREPKNREQRELGDERTSKKDLDKMDGRELVEELYKTQKDRKCFVVLDDLWEIKDWKLLSPAFPFEEANSKILMTTRNRALAEIQFAHELGHLSEDDGWKLLRRKAFSKRSIPVPLEDAQIDPQFEDFGREMVRKCGRLPLAISVLGGILSKKVFLQDWERISRDVDTYLRRDKDGKDEYGGVSQVLALSYDSLPSHLKPCFLYLGHFGEDEDIDVDMLYQMWIAEGMILLTDQSKEETLVDVAEYYLSEMAQRSMVQVKVNELSKTRNFKSCRLHDLLRDFCLDHGGKVEFLQVLDFGGTNNPLSDSLANNPCRYSIHDFNGVAIPVSYEALEPNEHLRSLLLHSLVPGVSFPQKICDFKSFKFLRVLNIFGYDFVPRKLPKAFKMLNHLRFLCLYGCRLHKVQTWICNLQYLQTIDLRVNVEKGPYSDVFLPNVWGKLKQLRHLYLPSEFNLSGIRARVKGLTKLETLGKFFCDEVNISDLSDLINLRHLHVKVRGERTLAGILNHLNGNRKLKEVWLHVSRANLSQDVFACLNLHHLKLSSYQCIFKDLQLSIPSNLIELDLKDSRLIEGDPMETLGKLSNLRSLTIRNSYSSGRGDISLSKLICHPKCFPELRYLTFRHLDGLKNLEVFEGAMPRLSYLAIEFCEDLEMIPEGLRFTTEIKELNMVMPEEFNDRVRVINGQEGVDFYKITHIPSVSLKDVLTKRGYLRRMAEERRLAARANN